MRVSIFQNMEKHANAAPVLILFPTVFCIFPPLLIILLVPIMLKLLKFKDYFEPQ